MRAPPLVRHITLIQHWFEELKAKAPAGGAKQADDMVAPLYSPPAPAGDALYLATANRLYLIAEKH